MRQSSVVPVNSARNFGTNELFFSTTDRKGVIEAGNGVFARIAGYSFEELIGAPHNIIRHPDMPRAVFKLFWDYLHDGKMVAAYVKNMAQDGCFYWVLALAIPAGDRYLSVRFKPTSPLQSKVEKLYAEMRQLEIAAAEAGDDGAAGMAAATDLLLATLRDLGFADYDAFMRALLREELKSRDAILRREGLEVVPALPAARGDSADDRATVDAIRAIHEGCLEAYQHLSQLFVKLDTYVALNERLGLKSASVLELTTAFRFISLNTAVKSARLGQQGAGLGVIAGYLGDSSAGVSKIVGGLTERIGTASERLAAVIFGLAGARLQTEMVVVFCHELIASITAGHAADDADVVGRQHEMIEDLKNAFVNTIGTTTDALSAFGRELGGLSTISDELQKIMLTLEFTQLSGMVEAYRLDQVATFGIIFTEVRKQLDETKTELLELSSITETLTGLVVEAPRIAAVLSQAESGMERQIAQL